MHQPGGYRSPYGLQARMWKMACKDAWETLDKFWLAIAEEMKPLVYRKNKWNPEMKHYANWLLFRSRRIAALYARQTPIPEKISISSKERSVVAKILGMEIRKRVKCLPRTHMARSACFDANMYSVVQTNKGNQVICLMGLSPYKRISVPLVGYTSLSGNIRLVMEKDSQTFEIHTVYNLTPTTTLQEEKAGIDIGQSEVFTDNKGSRYGKGFGAFLEQASKVELTKSRRRQKLHSLRKKAFGKGDKAKARRIKVNNLGYKKLNRRRKRNRAECERQLNTAFNTFLKVRQPTSIAQEKLDFRGKEQ